MKENFRKTDQWVRKKAESESWDLPDTCKERVEHILAGLSGTTVDKEGIKMKKIRSRRIMVLAAALAALVGTTAVASGLFTWNKKAVENFGNPSKEEQDAMTMEGTAREQTVSATDAGITITAKQTVQDKNILYILLEIQSDEAVIDGNGMFDNPDANGAYDGTPWMQTEDNHEFSNISAGFTPDTPAYAELSRQGYYEIKAIKSMNQAWASDSATLRFTEYSYYTYENGDTVPHSIRGDWELSIPLGEDTKLETKCYEPGQKIDLSGVPVTVKRVELSPLSLSLAFDLDDLNRLQEELYAGKDDIYIQEVECSGFLDKDGKELECRTGGMSGKHDLARKEAVHVIGLDQYMDIESIQAVLLGEDKVPVALW